MKLWHEVVIAFEWFNVNFWFFQGYLGTLGLIS